MARVRPGWGQLVRALDAPIQPGLSRSLKKRKGSSEARGNRCQQLQPKLPVAATGSRSARRPEVRYTILVR